MYKYIVNRVHAKRLQACNIRSDRFSRLGIF